MEAAFQVRLQSLEPYRHLFPKAKAVDKTVKMGATVSDTVDFIPEIVKHTSWQVKKYVEQELKGLSVYDACEKLWHFVKFHIKYEPDERGIEQVRSPRRLIHDAKGDCDCGTTFIDACLVVFNSFLLELKNSTPGIKKIVNRITKYKKDYFQHIYPIVFLDNGQRIIMDFVVGSFNYEEPYTEKKDYPMELQFLDGIEDRNSTLLGIDAQDLFGWEKDLGELGKLFKKKSNNNSGGSNPAPKKHGLLKRSPEKNAKAKVRRQNFKKKTLKVVNKVNRVNPAMLLLRAGILASMKLNVEKVPQSLKWAYATPELAQSKGMDMSKYGKLKNILKKIEKIFYGAGGKPENLKKAILTGRGNRNHEVAGLNGYDEDTALPTLLGAIYDDEFINGMEGFEGLLGLGELGGPATATALAAASSAITTIAALIKSVGTLFPKKAGNKNTSSPGGEGSDSDSSADSGAPSNDDASNETSDPSDNTNAGESQSVDPDQTEPATEEPADDDGGTENLPATTNSETDVATTDESTNNEVSDNSDNNAETPDSSEETTQGILGAIPVGIKVFWQKNKKLIVGTGIVVVGVVATAIAIKHYSKKNETTRSSTKPKQYALSGIGKRRKQKKKKGGKSKRHREPKSLIALM